MFVWCIVDQSKLLLLGVDLLMLVDRIHDQQEQQNSGDDAGVEPESVEKTT